jgi:hypothetical protein
MAFKIYPQAPELKKREPSMHPVEKYSNHQSINRQHAMQSPKANLESETSTSILRENPPNQSESTTIIQYPPPTQKINKVKAKLHVSVSSTAHPIEFANPTNRNLATPPPPLPPPRNSKHRRYKPYSHLLRTREVSRRTRHCRKLMRRKWIQAPAHSAN